MLGFHFDRASYNVHPIESPMLSAGEKKPDYRQTEGSELDLKTRSNVHCRRLSIYLAIMSSKVCH